MTDRPIIFSAPMVRALLDGRKTQTRRVVKDRGARPEYCGGRCDDRNDPSNWGWEDHERGEWVTLDRFRSYRFVPYAPGDRLWVREAHYLTDDGESEYAVFASDQRDVDEHFANMQTLMARHQAIDWSKHLRRRPSIHMPRWASRLTLIVTDVRVQRLQQISETDAEAEGVFRHVAEYSLDKVFRSDRGAIAIQYFTNLWNSLYGPDAWAANPWVAAISFDVKRANIDQIGGDA